MSEEKRKGSTSSSSPNTNLINHLFSQSDCLKQCAILKHFILSEPSNRASIYNQLANIEFDYHDIGGHGRLPASLDKIKQSITHSKNGEDIEPETLLDHLKIHLNKLKFSKKKKYLHGKNKPLANHPAEQCCFESKKANSPWAKRQPDSYVSSFLTFSSISPSTFIIDSGSTAHMVSDSNLFLFLYQSKRSLIDTSCGSNTLEIEGKSTEWPGGKIQ
ncbi:hypothetical protein VP01_1687g3 [Puccinia sorghi]|uniref:Uncharacterized protein n=1 Tax=Puccinia sorghi TaxID=27349 RepID=A0A0L6VFW8_9BASI|nr:hypothetical protein VP01_1687g3 [Puccinia sorghi]